MNEFEQRLMRLKECLQLTEDQQIAQALGMTKAAFSNRKRSGSFPDEKVIGLKAKNPNLDVAYILSGRRLESLGRAGRLLDSHFSVAAEKRMDDQVKVQLADALRAQLEDDDQRAPMVRALTDLLPWCSDDDLELLTRVAARLASNPGPRRVPETKGLRGQHAAGAGKTSSAELQLVTKGKRTLILGDREAAPMVVGFDEAHRSNPRTSGAVKGLSSKATISMTATPKRTTPAAAHVEGVTKQQSRARAKAKPQRA